MLHKLPPGPRLLISRIPYVSTPPLCVFLATSLLKTLGALHLPTFVVILACCLSFPLFLLGRRAWKDVSTKKAAAARGAIVAPLAKRDAIMAGEEKRFPRTFLGPLLSESTDAELEGAVLGDSLFRLCETHGYSFMLKMSFSKRVCAPTWSLGALG